MRLTGWLAGSCRTPTGGKRRGVPRRRPLEVELLEKRELLSAASDRFVGQVYRDLLGRPADPGALAVWGGLLEHGGSRTGVALGVAASAEYRAGLVRRLYT